MFFLVLSLSARLIYRWLSGRREWHDKYIQVCHDYNIDEAIIFDFGKLEKRRKPTVDPNTINTNEPHAKIKRTSSRQ